MLSTTIHFNNELPLYRLSSVAVVNFQLVAKLKNRLKLHHDEFMTFFLKFPGLLLVEDSWTKNENYYTFPESFGCFRSWPRVEITTENPTMEARKRLTRARGSEKQKPNSAKGRRKEIKYRSKRNFNLFISTRCWELLCITKRLE